MNHFKKAVFITALVCLLCSLSYTPAEAAVPFDCSVTEIPLAECQALIALYESTNGDQWTNTNSNLNRWFATNVVSNWYGVTVTSGRVTQLNLSNNNLAGSIPDDLGDLEALMILNLSNNKLKGSIPGSLFEIPDIREIVLSNNILSGDIPATIGSASAPDLVKFIADHNNLSGVIPATVGSVLELNTLVLSNNDLYGPIPVSLINLTYLTTLDLTNNGLWATDTTLKTFIDTKNPGWSTTQTAQSLYPLGGGIVGWATNSSTKPVLVVSDMWFSNIYRVTEFHFEIFRSGDDLNILDKYILAYTTNGICSPATWTEAITCRYEPSWSDFKTLPVENEEYYWRVSSYNPSPSAGWINEVDLDRFRLGLTPYLYFPKDVVTVGNPLYTWSEVEGAISYHLMISLNGSVVRNVSVPTSVCWEDVCSYTPFSFNIPPGDYTWQVRAKISEDPLGYTQFSPITSFTKYSPPQSIKPIGKITAQNPAFTWTKIEGATKYKVKVLFGETLIAEEVINNPTCNTTTCTNTAGITLGNGNFTWQTSAFTGSWGDYGDSVAITKLSPPTPKFPVTSTTVKNPKFIWSKVAGQTQYRLVVMNPSGLAIRDKIISSPNCSATTNTCSYTFTGDQSLSLVDGASFKWKVKSYNGIWGDYSSPKSFKKLAPPAVVSPVNTITAANPKFTWKQIPGATEYTIELRKSTGVLVKTMKVTKINCGAGNCWYYSSNIPLNLAAGSYKWHVKAFNGYYGPYGVYKAFTKK